MSFASQNWNTGKLTGMFRRAYLICTEEIDLNHEIEFLINAFEEHGYPEKVIGTCQHGEMMNY